MKLNGEVTGLGAFVGPSTWFKLLIHMILRAGKEGKFTKNCSEHGVDIKKNSEEFFKLTPIVGERAMQTGRERGRWRTFAMLRGGGGEGPPFFHWPLLTWKRTLRLKPRPTCEIFSSFFNPLSTSLHGCLHRSRRVKKFLIALCWQWKTNGIHLHMYGPGEAVLWGMLTSLALHLGCQWNHWLYIHIYSQGWNLVDTRSGVCAGPRSWGLTYRN